MLLILSIVSLVITLLPIKGTLVMVNTILSVILRIMLRP
jgi:hypothetical protein